MNWKRYNKSHFRVIGALNNINHASFKELVNGRWVQAICISKLDTDTDVVVGNTYPVYWYSLSNKCDAPDPPFSTGEGAGGGLMAINYKNYAPESFEIIGDFIPDDTVEYPTPPNNGAYKVAICRKKLDTDVDAVLGGYYVIIYYEGQDKLDAPDPPFSTGESHGGKNKI